MKRTKAKQCDEGDQDKEVDGSVALKQSQIGPFERQTYNFFSVLDSVVDKFRLDASVLASSQ